MVNGPSVIMPIGTKPGQPASRVALVTDRVAGIMAQGILTETKYEEVAARSVWPYLRRSRRLAGRRHRAGHRAGRCAGRQGMPGLWRGQGRLRDDRNRLINGAGL